MQHIAMINPIVVTTAELAGIPEGQNDLKSGVGKLFRVEYRMSPQ